MARVKQSVVVPMFLGAPPKLSMEEVCRAAAEIGYAAVEMWGAGEDFEDQVATAHRYGLRVASFGGHRGGGLGWNIRADHDVLEQQLRASIDLAVKHAVPGLICLSGNRQEGRSQEEAIAVTAEGLARVAPYAEEKGVNLNLEVLNSKVDHAGYDCDSTAWAVAVCRLVNSPRVRILYDIYHMQIMEGDVIRTIRDNIEWIGHFHTAGNPGRHDMDDEQELNYAGICRAIAATDYDLYVGHEFSAKGDVVAALRQAFQLCDQG